VQAKKSMTWTSFSAYKIANFMTGTPIAERINLFRGIDTAGNIESTVRTATVESESIGVFEGKFDELSNYATLELTHDIPAEATFAYYVLSPPVDRPSKFTLEVEWRNTLIAGDFSGITKQAFWADLVDSNRTLDFQSMAIYHSTGVNWQPLIAKSYEQVGGRYVVYFKGSWSTGLGFTNIGTIRVQGTHDVTEWALKYVRLETTVSPFDKPTEADLIIEYRETIDIALT